MDIDLAKRLAWARETAGLKTAADASARLGVNKYTYNQHENGTRGFPVKAAAVYARAFRVDLEWLLLGRGDPRKKVRGINIIGKVAAGAEGLFEDDYAMGAGDPIDPFPSEAIALIVEGESMVPRFNPGEVLIFGPRIDDPSLLLGMEVMARIDDGRKMIKILRRGSAPNAWNLHSINSAYGTVENATVLWVLPLLGMKTHRG